MRGRGLELVIPPPVAVGLAAGLMYAQARWLPLLPFGRQAAAAIVVALASAALAVLAAREFRRAATTINPMRPDRATTLVTSGVFARTRNPIYVADAILLAAWGLWLGDAAAFAAIPPFVGYLTRYQVLPEERTLREKFGEPYCAYLARTRRWL